MGAWRVRTFERPVGGVAAEADERTTRVALTRALATLGVPGTQHRRVHEVVIPGRLVAHVVGVIVH